jgi:hypothetical protein
MGWIHDTQTRVVQHNHLAIAAANIAVYRTANAYKSFKAFENGENPQCRDLMYSHTLSIAVYDGSYPYLMFTKGMGVVEVDSYTDLLLVKEKIRAANAVSAEASEVAAAYAAGMTFYLYNGILAVKRRFPKLADRIDNADITSNGEDLRGAERIYGYCAVGEEVIFALTGETHKTKHIPTGEGIVLNTLTGKMYFHQP